MYSMHGTSIWYDLDRIESDLRYCGCVILHRVLDVSFETVLV